MSRKLLEVRAVDKQFDGVKAVDGLSFEVQRGQVFALLGPNGAGKTTMVRMLMGILRPDRGSIFYAIAGESPAWPQPAELGYLPEDRGLYRETPILRTLTYFGVLRGMERKNARRAAEQWLERMGLARRGEEGLDALSKGNQQKVQFAAAVLHRPAFAVLDEPFSGFDPVNQDAFLELIRDLRDAGMTILLSAHQMHLVERIADHILLISRGREVLRGSLEDIRRSARAGHRIVLRVEGAADLSLLDRHPAVANVKRSAEQEITLLIRDGASLSDLLVTLGRQLDITDIHTEKLNLHDIYVQAVAAEGGAGT